MEEEKPRSFYRTLNDIKEFIEGPTIDSFAAPIEDVIADLQNEGIDASKSVANFHNWLKSEEAKERLKKGKEIQNQTFERFKKFRTQASRDGAKSPSPQAVYFRNFEKQTDRDRQSLEEDIKFLEQEIEEHGTDRT